MGYLDDLGEIFGAIDGDADAPAPQEASSTTVLDEHPFDIARRQLATGRTSYYENPEGTFRACGSRFGCGYAEAVAVVDPQTGEATVDINANLRVSPSHIKGARKLFRKLNQGFIVAGLMVDDDGWVHFKAEDPAQLKEGGDVNDYLEKGFSTLHAHASMVAQLEAGREAWDIFAANRAADEDE